MTKKKERKLQTYVRPNVIIEHKWPIGQWVQRTGDVPPNDYDTARIEGYWLNTLGCPMVSLYGVSFDMYLEDFERLHEPAEVMVFGVGGNGIRLPFFRSLNEARSLLEDDEDGELFAFVSIVGGSRITTDYVDDLSRK